MVAMNFQSLRALFDLLCERLEDDQVRERLHFEAGCGVEFPEGVIMIFVFQHLVLVCRFQASDQLGKPVVHHLSQDQPVSAQDCLDMTLALREAKGFQELFQ